MQQEVEKDRNMQSRSIFMIFIKVMRVWILCRVALCDRKISLDTTVFEELIYEERTKYNRIRKGIIG